jgi:glycosyltransferase involved in cell wall biosynthesis
VHFTGYQKNAANLIKQFDINVAPSRGREGLTKTVIEAMIHGVPNIVSDAGGLPELITDEETGLIFQKNSAGSLKKRLDEINKNHKYREFLGENGKANITKNFTIEKTIIETLNLYKRL